MSKKRHNSASMCSGEAQGRMHDRDYTLCISERQEENKKFLVSFPFVG